MYFPKLFDTVPIFRITVILRITGIVGITSPTVGYIGYAVIAKAFGNRARVGITEIVGVAFPRVRRPNQGR